MRQGIRIDKSSYEASAQRKERAFKLSLTTSVSGVDAFGNSFQERTELTSISSQEAAFLLNSRVTIGSPLSLSLDIPKTLILESPLKMLLCGKVKCVRAETNRGKKQFISIELDKTYKIQSFIQKF